MFYATVNVFFVPTAHDSRQTLALSYIMRRFYCSYGKLHLTIYKYACMHVLNVGNKRHSFQNIGEL